MVALTAALSTALASALGSPAVGALSAAGHRGEGVPVIVALVALIALVIAFVQVLWGSPIRFPKVPHRPKRGRHRR